MVVCLRYVDCVGVTKTASPVADGGPVLQKALAVLAAVGISIAEQARLIDEADRYRVPVGVSQRS